MNAKVLRLVAVAALIAAGGCGLSKPMTYPGTASTPDLHEPGVIVLGEVEGCRGAYCPSSNGEGGQELPLALASVPPASSYHTVLRKRAAVRFHISELDVRLGEVTVRYYKELDGTITGWQATAPAGKLAAP